MSGSDSGFSVIALYGESDAYIAPRVRSDLATALGSEAPLVVDLTQATFIDSTIVGILLEGLADCEKRERPLLLLLPDDAAPEVHRLFEITGLGGTAAGGAELGRGVRAARGAAGLDEAC